MPATERVQCYPGPVWKVPCHQTRSWHFLGVQLETFCYLEWSWASTGMFAMEESFKWVPQTAVIHRYSWEASAQDLVSSEQILTQSTAPQGLQPKLLWGICFFYMYLLRRKSLILSGFSASRKWRGREPQVLKTRKSLEIMTWHIYHISLSKHILALVEKGCDWEATPANL